MPSYLFTACKSDGTRVTERITAASVDGARYALETRRYTDIVFHTDDAVLQLDEAARRDINPHETQQVLSPEQEVEARHSGGLLSHVWFAWKLHAGLWVPLGIWCAFAYFGSRPFGWGDWIGFALTGVFLIYFLVLAVPGTLFQALLRASVWNRLGEVRLLVAALKRLPMLGGGFIPRLELDLRLAFALARNDRIEEAKQLLAPYLDNPANDSMTLDRLSGFFDAAKEHDKAHQLRLRAVELSNDGVFECIDLALGLARYLRKPTEARAALARIANKEIVDFARIYVLYIEALIALEEERSDAVSAFEKADSAFAPFESNELMNGVRRELWAYQCIALAEVGRTAEARALLLKARPLLQARRETELLQRCDEALKLGT